MYEFFKKEEIKGVVCLLCVKPQQTESRSDKLSVKNSDMDTFLNQPPHLVPAGRRTVLSTFKTKSTLAWQPTFRMSIEM